MKKLSQLFAISAITLTVQGCNSDNAVTQKNSNPLTENSQAQFSIPFEKYQLANGLEVVLHQDKSDPVVAVAIQYHVGSNREKQGKTGFAHFFEHMLFQNSENVGPGNFIKNIGDMGGILNGGTWQDGTIYYEVVPSDGLESVLWMESDRMGYFINTVTQEGLENEKQVVKNEKRQGVDNRPYGHTDYVVLKALYPENHPYNWDVIGSLEDLQNATLQDVRDFYQQWYGVNNATLVIAGDFEAKDTKAWVEKYFGELKPRNEVKKLPPMPAVLKENKSFYHEDNFAQLPELTLTFPSIEQYHKDAYALDLLAELLVDGKNSPLYSSIVINDKLAPNVRANNHSAQIAGTFSITVRAFPNTPLDKVKSSIEKSLQTIEHNALTEGMLARAKTRRETEFYRNLTSVFDKASAIAQHNELGGDPSLVTKEIERYQAVTLEDVVAVYKKYVKDKHYVATSFVPKGQKDLALTGAIKADVVEEKIVQGAEQQMAAQAEKEPLAPLAQAPSSFDRSVMPAPGKSKSVELPDIWQSSLANGVQVLGIEHNELPLVSFSIRVMGGHALDPDNKNGVANLLTSIMMEGTKDKTPEQLEQALGDIGAELHFSTSGEFITLEGSTLSKHFDKAVALAQEVLLSPRWDEAEWDRVKAETVAQIQQAQANPGAIAHNVYAKLMYDNNNKLSSPVTGNIDEVNSITLDDVKAYYHDNIIADLTTIHVAGDIKQQEVVKQFNALGKQLKNGKVELPLDAGVLSYDKPTLYFVDVPDAKQSFIRIGSPAMKANAKDYYNAVAVNHNLGGSFSGQLFQILRLQKGYTYGAYSGLNRSNFGGTFVARSSVRANVTLESLQTFREILGNYGKAFDEDALANTKSVLQKSNARAFETTGSLLNVLENISSYDLSQDYVKEQQQQLQALTIEEAQAAISSYINPDKMVYLVVGDAKTQLPRMQELGLGEPILLDKNGIRIEQPMTTQ
mgnify:CR=1 FL=1